MHCVYRTQFLNRKHIVLNSILVKKKLIIKQKFIFLGTQTQTHTKSETFGFSIRTITKFMLDEFCKSLTYIV